MATEAADIPEEQLNAQPQGVEDEVCASNIATDFLRLFPLYMCIMLYIFDKH
jgi:hypothetical protein